MRKAVLKRIKITKRGKMLHRHSGQNHFNAKESRRVQLREKKAVALSTNAMRKMKVYSNN